VLYIGGKAPNDDIATDSGGPTTVHLGGIYVISAVSLTQITLSAPATVNANWAALAGFSGGVSAVMGADNIMANNPWWIGGNTALATPVPPFFLPFPSVTELWFNFVAEQGSYFVDDSNGVQTAANNVLEVGITPCDATGTPTGGNVTYYYLVRQ